VVYRGTASPQYWRSAWSGRGHSTGTYNGIQGRGQTIDFNAFDIQHVGAGTRIIEDWHLEDNLTFPAVHARSLATPSRGEEAPRVQDRSRRATYIAFTDAIDGSADAAPLQAHCKQLLASSSAVGGPLC